MGFKSAAGKLNARMREDQGVGVCRLLGIHARRRTSSRRCEGELGDKGKHEDAARMSELGPGIFPLADLTEDLV